MCEEALLKMLFQVCSEEPLGSLPSSSLLESAAHARRCETTASSVHIRIRLPTNEMLMISGTDFIDTPARISLPWPRIQRKIPGQELLNCIPQWGIGGGTGYAWPSTNWNRCHQTRELQVVMGLESGQSREDQNGQCRRHRYFELTGLVLPAIP